MDKEDIKEILLNLFYSILWIIGIGFIIYFLYKIGWISEWWDDWKKDLGMFNVNMKMSIYFIIIGGVILTILSFIIMVLVKYFRKKKNK